jgi:SAM-dependent methyltransferase
VGSPLAVRADLARPQALVSYLEANRASWERLRGFQREHGASAWARDEPVWGLWSVPESELRALPEDVAGLDVVELGCGTAYWSAWLARRGARPVGVDLTPGQLELARELQAGHGLEFPLVEANAEEVPLPNASFDLALSEYGAASWCDPYRWIPEAARLLRPGGLLVFMAASTIRQVAGGEGRTGTEVRRDYFGMHRLTSSDGTTMFHLPYGDTIRLLRRSGLDVENLIEVQAPPDAQTHPVYDYVTAEWARQWPAEHVWVARKT